MFVFLAGPQDEPGDNKECESDSHNKVINVMEFTKDLRFMKTDEETFASQRSPLPMVFGLRLFLQMNTIWLNLWDLQ